MCVGCGVPIFCIMIRNSLYHAGVVGYPTALFVGALLPYLLSWLLYQGNALMHLLAWTGLLVNGLVAFVLPLVLSLSAMGRAVAAPLAWEEEREEWEEVSSACAPSTRTLRNDDVHMEEESGLLGKQTMQGSYASIETRGAYGHLVRESSWSARLASTFLVDSRVKLLFARSTVSPLSANLMPYKKLIVQLALSIFCAIIISNIVLVVYFGVPLDAEEESNYDQASLSSALLASSLAGFYQQHMLK